MQVGRHNTSRIDCWGDSMMGKLPARSRKRRKRQASKKRRQALRRRGKDMD